MAKNRPVQGEIARNSWLLRRFAAQRRAIWRREMACHDSIRGSLMCMTWRAWYLLSALSGQIRASCMRAERTGQESGKWQAVCQLLNEAVAAFVCVNVSYE